MLFYKAKVRKLTEDTEMEFKKNNEKYKLSSMDLLHHIANKVHRAVLEYEEEKSGKDKPAFDKTDPVVAYSLQRCGVKEDETAFDGEDFATLKKQICERANWSRR